MKNNKEGQNQSFHSSKVEDALTALESEFTGLEEQEAKNRLEKYGPNEIAEKKKQSLIVLFLKQFNSPLIYILFIAAVISFFFGKIIDTYVILFVIAVNAIIGFVQEFQAEKSIEALKKMIVATAKVFRSGELKEVKTADLVPGDVVFLEEGDKIPADGRIIESKNFRTQESSLTGESFPVNKSPNIVRENITIGDRSNMVWMGTFAVAGNAHVLVTATGGKTVLGEIAASIEKIKHKKWHFEQKTEHLAKLLAVIAFIASALVFFVGFFIRGFSFPEIFIFTIASLVSSIPEGLPAVITIVLAIGAHRMANKNAIVRTLPSIETLSVVDTIVTDKTGTLTQNTITAEEVFLPKQEMISVSGDGWKPNGNFHQNEEIIMPFDNNQLSKLLHVAAVCNNAKVVKEENEEYSVIGDPTEAALAVLAEKSGLREEVVKEYQVQVSDLPFNSENKYRATLVELKRNNNKKEIYVVGAPEFLINMSSCFLEKNTCKKVSQKDKKEFIDMVEQAANQGLRTVAVAYKEMPKETKDIHTDLVKDLNFAGIIAMKDPLRHDVKDAVKKAHRAGIRVIMATGDHKGTALSIAREIGLVGKRKKNSPEVLTGMELENMDDKSFAEAVSHVSVFARLTPQMKYKIADALQKIGRTIAMTGDGVNDAAALKKADIGISMGVIGTDVARESSEIVLADDNFASIMSAIEEGRVVFNNTRRVSSFVITTTFAGNTTILSTMFLGLPLPFLPIHILWINLVTDTVSGATLATEPVHENVLRMPPRRTKDNILTKEFLPFIIFMALFMALLTVTVFTFNVAYDVKKAMTSAFVVLALTQLFNMFNLRSLTSSIFKIKFLTNKNSIIGFFISIVLILLVLYLPFLQGVFQFYKISLAEFFVFFLISSLVLFVGELYKFAVYGRKY